MKHLLLSWGTLALLGSGFLAHAAASNPTQVRPPKAIPENRYKIGRDVIVPAGVTNGDVVVVSGNANIQGHVRGNVIVVAGDVDLNGTVTSNLVVVAGAARLGPQARLQGHLVRVGARVTADSTARLEGPQIQVEMEGHARHLRRAVDWLVKGLLQARPFPPQLRWMWGLLLLCLLLHLALLILFPRTAQAALEMVERRPVGSVFVGLLVLLLLGPVVALLAISGVGLLALPFLACALSAALVFGKIAVYRFTGQHLGRLLGGALLQQPLVALAVGSVIFYALYAVPVAGFVALGLATLIGLGAAVLAALSSVRRESAHSGPAAPAPVIAAPGEAPPHPADLALLPRVGFWRRLAATALDWCLLLIVLVPLKQVALPVWLAYHVVMWALKGTTVGGMVLGVRLVREDGRPLSWSVALVRALAAVVSALALFLGFFWAGWSREKRAWHDRIAGTIAVRVPPGMAML